MCNPLKGGGGRKRIKRQPIREGTERASVDVSQLGTFEPRRPDDEWTEPILSAAESHHHHPRMCALAVC